MKNDTPPHLRLVSGGKDSSKDYLTSCESNSPSLRVAALSLFEARSTGVISPDAVDAIALALQSAAFPQTIVQRALDVSINLINPAGDASICFKYDISNFGRRSLPSRTHRFWFTAIQEDISLSASMESGFPLRLETIETGPTFKEIRVHFPKPLDPADQIAYRIQYQLKKDFLKTDFYNIRAWSLTGKVSLSVTAPECLHFADATVALESSDGYISDCPPMIAVSNEFGRSKLTWNHRSAKSGDLFRTRWSLA